MKYWYEMKYESEEDAWEAIDTNYASRRAFIRSPKYEIFCPKCRGYRFKPAETKTRKGKMFEIEKCDWSCTGKILTEEAAELVSFLKEHFAEIDHGHSF